mgnify:CR=1 FL=1
MKIISVRWRTWPAALVDIAAHPDIIKLYSVDVFHQWLAMPESLALISEALTAIRDNGW